MVKYFFFFLLFFFNAVSQESYSISWSGTKTFSYQDSLITVLDFDHSAFNPLISLNNTYFQKIPIEHNDLNLEIIDVVYTEVLNLELKNINQTQLSSSLDYNYYVGTEKKQNFLFFYLVPFIKEGNSIHKVSSFKIKINKKTRPISSEKKARANS